jgi:phosphopantetheinyl transferase (holo-ACP synthase)
VDLKFPDNVKRSLDSRFLEKILTDHEIAFVKRSLDSDVALWSFWACKEAAYKVLQKQAGGVHFVPRRWSVRYLNFPDDPNGVRFRTDGCMDAEVIVPDAAPVHAQLFFSPNYIHCLATDTFRRQGEIFRRVEALPAKKSIPYPDASSFVRRIVIRRIAAKLNLPEDTLQIVRQPAEEGLGPPLLYHADVQSSVDISLSHDGRYVAYAFIL